MSSHSLGHLGALTGPAGVVSHVPDPSDGSVAGVGRSVDPVLRLGGVQQHLQRRDGVQLRRLFVDFA